MRIIDAHEDLAWNMLTFGRDYTRSAVETRRREAEGEAPACNGDTLLGWSDYQRGQVAVVFATLFAAPVRRKVGPWDRLCYRDIAEANRLYRDQVDAYRRLCDEHPDHFRLVGSQGELQAVLDHWQRSELDLPKPPGLEAELDAGHASRAGGERAEDDEVWRGHPVGLVTLMEGAEGVRAPAELEEWWELGVRIIGPAWAGTRYCGGTREPGPLTPEGFALLEAMAGLGFTLDISHMDEQAVRQALDFYPGRVIASHANALALLKGTDSNRFLSDRVLRSLIERDGIVGVVPYNSFLKVGWKAGDRREEVTLRDVAAHIDKICQMAGDACHVGIGSDFDGGFGLQSAPAEVDTIADLQKLVPLLIEKGYTEADAAAVLEGNWLAFLGQSLPG